ncbi:hypothetical protein [Aureimonas sp. N4]|uniref:hypothetical protein n=1 Tax=Aureimonas sp. N4 TaxID=1638165 RepID=UPI0012E3DD3C|nr:hypothetical protein [Aureimonas sp. N4]
MKRRFEPTWKERKATARRFDKRLRKFAIRKGSHNKLSDALVSDMFGVSGTELRSAYIPARISFTSFARKVATERLKVSRYTPAFMVTLTPRQFALPFSEALEFDWSQLQLWCDHTLQGINYFGIVEVSYYTSHPVPRCREPICHFHAHVIAWGVKRQDLREIELRVNQKVPALLPGRLCFKADTLRSIKRVRSKLAYFLKPLMADYRGFPLKGGATAGWGQKKRDLRSGEAAKALRVFQGVNIEDLCIAGGEGVGLLEEVTRRAKQRLEIQHARRTSAFMRIFQ